MPPEQHILVVDDEPSIRDFIRRNLELRSYKITLASNGLEALSLFDEATFSLIILDIMMPRMDGLEVCSRIRRTSTVPILLLTALGDETDKIRGLDEGADDYLTKPFGVGELVARVKAMLRRSHWTDNTPSDNTQRIGDLELDFEQRRVWRSGEEIKLTPTEFDLLQELALHPGKVFTHQTLLRRVWGAEYGQEAEYLRVYIGRLRRKIEIDPSKPAHIITESGVGYYMLK